MSRGPLIPQGLPQTMTAALKWGLLTTRISNSLLPKQKLAPSQWFECGQTLLISTFPFWVHVPWEEICVCTQENGHLECVLCRQLLISVSCGSGNFVSVLYNFLFIHLCPFDLVVTFPSHKLQLQNRIRLMNDLIAFALRLILNNCKGSSQITFSGDFHSLRTCLITRKLGDRRETKSKCLRRWGSSFISKNTLYNGKLVR